MRRVLFFAGCLFAYGCAGIVGLSQDFSDSPDGGAALGSDGGHASTDATTEPDGGDVHLDNDGGVLADGSSDATTSSDGGPGEPDAASTDGGGSGDPDLIVSFANPGGAFSSSTFGNDNEFALVVDDDVAYLLGDDANGYLVIMTLALPTLSLTTSRVLVTGPVIGTIDDARLSNGTIVIASHVVPEGGNGHATLMASVYDLSRSTLDTISSKTFSGEHSQIQKITAVSPTSMTAVGTAGGVGTLFEFSLTSSATVTPTSLNHDYFATALDRLDVPGGSWIGGYCGACASNGDDLASYAFIPSDGGAVTYGSSTTSDDLPIAFTSLISVDGGVLAYGLENTAVLLTPLPLPAPPARPFVADVPGFVGSIGFSGDTGITRAIPVGGGHFVAVASSYSNDTVAALFCFDGSGSPVASFGSNGFYGFNLGPGATGIAAMGIAVQNGNLYSAFHTDKEDWEVARHSL